MTRRDTQITWLIRFSAAWKELPEPDRRWMLGDPWALKEFTARIDAPSAGSAQMAVLHLADPGTFEQIVSADHEQLITARFADVAGTGPDVDRRLLAARAALTPRYGEGFDWYEDWLVRLWLKDRNPGRPSSAGSAMTAAPFPARTRNRAGCWTAGTRRS